MNEYAPDVPSSIRPALLADTHVHFHPGFSWGVFLDSAAAHFAAARRTIEPGDQSPGCLIFTESAGANCFRALERDPEILASTGWRVGRTDEACSLRLTRDNATPIVIIAGRQIVTSERIEVLALGITEEFPDHRSIRDTLSALTEAGAIPVLPWGFGKWWGRRGRIVRGLLADQERGSFCLGDNGGRARRMPRPGLLQRAEEKGFIVLAGSDPLRIPSHMTRAGSYGSLFPEWEPTTRPMEAIRKRIPSLRRSPATFGSPSSLPRAVSSQLAIRLHRQTQSSDWRATGPP